MANKNNSNNIIEKFILTSKAKGVFLIEAKFKKAKEVEKEEYIFDDPINETSYINVGSEKDFNITKLTKIFKLILTNKERNYQIDLKSFVTKNVSRDEVLKNFVYSWYEVNGKVFNLKTNEDKPKQTYLLVDKLDSNLSEHILIATQLNEIRYLQNMAPNLLNINEFCKYIKSLSSNNNKLKLSFLDIKDMEKLKMNLIISVNKGSKQSAKVAIIEYNGNPKSKEKISFVGKGIMFDSGGYNLKTPVKYMIDMKFDMSGAAIAILLVDTIAKLNIKQNVSCVVPLTDNMVDSLGQVPESVWTSMSGKTVEVANTDAEGRLVLADALTYAATKLNSSLIIDLATLTGTVLYALGRYTGVWSTKDNNWKLLDECAKKSNELVWRMPLDEIYLETLIKDTCADTLSCSLIDRPDSNIAATWLNQFAMGKDYIHLDIAGSADINSIGCAPMFKTLIEFVKKY